MGKHSKTIDNETKKKTTISIFVIAIIVILCCVYICFNNKFDSNSNQLAKEYNNTNKNNNIESNKKGKVNKKEDTKGEKEKLEIIDPITYLNDLKSQDGEKLVLKSKTTHNKYIEYDFKDNILNKVRIIEKFDDIQKYNRKKSNYELQDTIKILGSDENEMILIIEKLDLETDEGLDYEQIKKKYLIELNEFEEKLN